MDASTKDMKRTILYLLAGAALSASSQTVPLPTGPTLQPSPLPPLIPTFPALPLIPGQPGLTNTPGTAGLSVATLSDLLTNLQNDIQQVLPTLAIFNDGFDFVPITGGQAIGITNGIGQTTGAGTGVPLAPNAAIAPGTTMSSAMTNAAGPLPGFAAFPVTRETLRALLVVQNDLERLLPLIDALNTGATLSRVGLNPVILPTGFTNIFGGTTNALLDTTTNGP